ncbi:NF-kappa-B inhibitor cactus-like [Anthonomus grandis grandis]|uniref:NF-kappa-B inhibitor cactus-like n=1 Tax=Anthonomus grandis grandis TaxID=2921223 RepID=UPI00216521BB|nr:NF-kappa-B inhibitor cactus-like [Anthonomus grandis grandis]
MAQHFPGTAAAADDSQHQELSKDEKCDLIQSSNVDSGFISSGSLMSGETGYSEDISKEKPKLSQPILQKSNLYREQQQQQFDSGLSHSKTAGSSMLVDNRGIPRSLTLSEKLGKLYIYDSGVASNDLNKPKTSLKKPPVESTSRNVPFYDTQDEDGDTQLHLAIAYGHVEVALALIRAAPCAAWLDTKNDRSQAPLHLAVEFGHYSIVRWLIIAGAKPCPRDAQGDSPLHIAARQGKWECVKAITEPVNPKHREIMDLSYPQSTYNKPCLDQWNYLGQTCVHVAAKGRHLRILKHLVECRADINAREGLEGLSALHYAVLNKDYDMINYLKRLPNADYYVLSYAGLNALQYAHLRNEQITKSRYPILKDLDSPYSSDSDSSDSSSDEDMPMTPAYRLYDNPGMSGICA